MQIIKKNKWVLITALLCAVIFFIFPLQQSLSDDAMNTVNPKSVKKGGIELSSERYDMSHYEALTSTSDEGMIDSKLISGMNSIANFFFAITKLIGEVIDTGIGYLYSLDAIKLLSDKIGGISEILWNNLYETFGILFFLVAVLQIFFTVVIKKNGVAAGKKAFMLFLVIGISFIWFTNSSWYIKAINNLSSETQGVIMKAGTAFSTGSGQKITKGKELDGSLAVMRNAYFSIVVEKPYLLMNYGTPDKSEILKDDPNRIDNMLKYKMSQAGLKEKEKLIESEVNDLGNIAMSSGNIAQKMGVAFLSMIFAILLGLPLLLIAFLNLLLQVLVLGVALILPISFIMSFIPSFANSGWKTFGKMVGIFLLKALVGMVILFVFLIITIMDTIIPATNIGMYFLNGIAISICIILLIVFRDKVISLVSAGMVTSLDNNITDDASGYLLRKLNGRRSPHYNEEDNPESDETDDNSDEDEDEPENEVKGSDSSSESNERTTQEVPEQKNSELDLDNEEKIEYTNNDDYEENNDDDLKQVHPSDENDPDLDLPDSITEDEDKEKIDLLDSELEEPVSDRTGDYNFARTERVPQTLTDGAGINYKENEQNQEIFDDNHEDNENIDFEEKPLNHFEEHEQRDKERMSQVDLKESGEENDRFIINDWINASEEEYEETNND
ncbi:hypothetical protein KLP99_001631 [Listeria monocytogenes]|nr:hypothetical protein [Listeria monocytogenes]